MLDAFCCTPRNPTVQRTNIFLKYNNILDLAILFGQFIYLLNPAIQHNVYKFYSIYFNKNYCITIFIPLTILTASR